MLGSWLGIAGSRRIRGWQGVCPVCQTGARRDQHFALDMQALIRGFRTPAPCRTVVRVLGPAFESLPRRKPRGGCGLVGRARPMGICQSRTKRSWDFEGRWRGLFWTGTKTTSVFEGEHAGGERGRGAWNRTGDLVRTPRFCSGAQPEAIAIGIGRRQARRWRS
jgi:hypothetical protein